MPGRFQDFPLRPSVAREIIVDFLGEKLLWSRSEIDDRVDQIHRLEGGLPGKQSLSNVVKRALQDLQSEGRIVNRLGHWQCVNGDVVLDDSPLTLGETSSELPSDEMGVEEEVDVVAEKQIGDGAESVYLFFNPNDRELAELKGRNTWECKVGRTSVSNSLARVFSLRTALSHQPVVGLVIRTDDSAAMEKALHAALRLVEAAVPDSPGVEWFMTSPSHIEEWYGHFQESLNSLSRSIPIR